MAKIGNTIQMDIDRYNVVLDLPSGWSTPSVTGSTYGEDQVNAATIAVKYALYLHKWVALQMFDCLCRDIGKTKYIPNRIRQARPCFRHSKNKASDQKKDGPGEF